ncbi:MAG: histidine triad nucleotide-binding protein [Candidatus Omnitrophica bacterium]|nr:histidine triad nucleotide-binding protein [Candidatus Omnitrophota bacterium]
MNGSCLFCKIVKGDIPAKIVHQDADVVAFHDIKPQAPTHVLIVPRQHIAKIDDITEFDQLTIGKLVHAGKVVASKLGINHEGYRLVFNNGPAAGQEVYHIHLHVLGGRNFAWPPG